jgi:MoaA/NifB/PqqE/SkfB family radical SAM enzyme
MKHFFRHVLGFDDLKEKIEILEKENILFKKHLQEVNDCLFPFIADDMGRHWRIRGKGSWMEQRLCRIVGEGILNTINVQLTDHCNLNCTGCLNFSPLSEPVFLALNEFEKDMSCLSHLTHQLLKVVTLYGGEPLLHPQFLDFVKLTRKYFPNTAIKIITNGILLAKQDDNFWKVLHANAANLRISDYPIDIKTPLIKEKAKMYDVNVEMVVGDGYRQLHFIFDLDGQCDPQENFLQCVLWSSVCAPLRKGKIYLCPVCAQVELFNRYFKKNLIVTPQDYIDIYKVESVNEILQFLATPSPFCRYCDMKKIIGYHKWEPGKREISEWT